MLWQGEDGGGKVEGPMTNPSTSFPRCAEKDPDPSHDEAYFKALEADLIAVSLKRAEERIQKYCDFYGSEIECVEREMEKHEKRVGQIRLWCFQRTTGFPF